MIDVVLVILMGAAGIAGVLSEHPFGKGVAIAVIISWGIAVAIGRYFGRI